MEGHQSRPDRAEYTLYAQQACLDVQGILCTVPPNGKPCTRLAARAGSPLSRADSTLYVQSTYLDVQRMFCTVKFSRNSIYSYIGSKNMISGTPDGAQLQDDRRALE